MTGWDNDMHVLVDNGDDSIAAHLVAGPARDKPSRCVESLNG